jgi:hypothetical protein
LCVFFNEASVLKTLASLKKIEPRRIAPLRKKIKGKTLHIPSFSETCFPWTVCTFCVILEQGKCVEIFFLVLMRSMK